MLRRHWLVIPIVLGLLAAPVFAADETAPTATLTTLEKAEGLFAAGKIAEARDAFEALSKASPDDAELAARVAVLEQVLELQSLVATEEISPLWERAACILHAFFHQREVPAVALAQDHVAHAKADSATTACLVAESLLALNRNADAAKFVEGLREGQKTDQIRMYWGIASVRLGKKEAVLEDLDLYGWPESQDPGELYDVARLRALLGMQDEAFATLTSAFEMCPPRALDGLKAMVKQNADFAGLRDAEGFAKVLATSSKATGSGCGSGCGGGGCGEKSDCDSCPEKSDCDSCPEKDGECCGSCDGGEKAAKRDCSGNCDDCPEKEKGCCGACDGDCENCPSKEGKAAEKTAEKGCCGSCK